jgi:hypothetical protein
MEEIRDAYKILVGKPEGKDNLGDLRLDEVLEIEGIGCERMDWMHVTQNRIQWRALLNTVMKLGSIKGREFLIS